MLDVYNPVEFEHPVVSESMHGANILTRQACSSDWGVGLSGGNHRTLTCSAHFLYIQKGTLKQQASEHANKQTNKQTNTLVAACCKEMSILWAHSVV